MVIQFAVGLSTFLYFLVKIPVYSIAYWPHLAQEYTWKPHTHKKLHLIWQGKNNQITDSSTSSAVYCKVKPNTQNEPFVTCYFMRYSCITGNKSRQYTSRMKHVQLGVTKITASKTNCLKGKKHNFVWCRLYFYSSFFTSSNSFSCHGSDQQ